jgi:hypothetical protein
VSEYPETPPGSPPPRPPGAVIDAASELRAHAASPELSAAMAETRTVRESYARLCREFGPAAQTGMSARISLTALNRHHEAAGLPVLSPRDAKGQPDMWDRQQAEITSLTAERDEARAERDNAREQLESAQRKLRVQAKRDHAVRIASARFAQSATASGNPMAALAVARETQADELEKQMSAGSLKPTSIRASRMRLLRALAAQLRDVLGGGGDEGHYDGEGHWVPAAEEAGWPE